MGAMRSNQSLQGMVGPPSDTAFGNYNVFLILDVTQVAGQHPDDEKNDKPSTKLGVALRTD